MRGRWITARPVVRADFDFSSREVHAAKAAVEVCQGGEGLVILFMLASDDDGERMGEMRRLTWNFMSGFIDPRK